MQKPAVKSFHRAILAAALLLFSFTNILAVQAEEFSPGENLGQELSVLYMADYVEGGSTQQVLAPDLAFQSAAATTKISVVYLGDWDPAAKTAFEYAKHIWEVNLASSVQIVVEATWKDMNYISPNVLGGAGAADYRANFTGAQVPNTWYPAALANKIARRDLDSTEVDIQASFNSGFSAWYFGTDGNPPYNKYDFVSVVLHEIGHGLGFTGSLIVSGGRGNWSSVYPFIYDRFTVNGSGQSLIDTGLFPKVSTALGTQLTSNNLYFNGPGAIAANQGVKPKLYAPGSWQQGSSYSHIDENTYKLAANALMTPSLSNGEVIHAPGAITLGIFQDLGWGAAVTPVPAKMYYDFLPNVAKSFKVGR